MEAVESQQEKLQGEERRSCYKIAFIFAYFAN